MALCFGFTMFSFRSLKYNNSRAPRLGRRFRISHASFGLGLGLGLTARPPWPAALLLE